MEKEIEVTTEMIEAGVERLAQLQGEVALSYAVTEVFRAMVSVAPKPARLQASFERHPEH